MKKRRTVYADSDFLILEQDPRVEVVEDGFIVPAAKFNIGIWSDRETPILASKVFPRRPISENPVLEYRDITGVPYRDEEVLYGGLYQPHYGHCLLDGLARLWPVLSDDKIRTIVYVCPGPRYLNLTGFNLVASLLKDRGIHIELLTKTERFAAIIVPEPAFAIPTAANRVYRDLLLDLGTRALGSRNVTPRDEPLYLSRAGLESGRRAVGEEDLEKSLEKAGFRVVRPETLPFEEQIAIIREHGTIVGFQGSQLHTILFSEEPKKVICFGNGYIDGAYITIDRLMDNQAMYLRAAQPKDYSAFVPLREYQEPFIIDPVDIAADLEQLLGIDIPTPVLTQETRMEFATLWARYVAKRNAEIGQEETASQRKARYELYLKNLQVCQRPSPDGT